MIIRILKSSTTFEGVGYNTNKVDKDKAELLKVANLGVLQGLTKLRKEDYRNYLLMLASVSKRVKNSQLHAVLSDGGKTTDRQELVVLAEKWLQAMGYGAQPYLLVFHKDTNNNHLHIVSSRVDGNGKKINDSFDKVRAVQALNKIMGVDEKQMIEKAKAYRFSTVPQFKLLLERQGFIFKDNWIIRSGKRVAEFKESELKFSEPDKRRILQLRAILHKYNGPDLEQILKAKFGVELVFHSKNGKPAYGYTVIDNAQKNVFKGSEIMRLNELQNDQTKLPSYSEPELQNENTERDAEHITVNISNDVDDEAVHRRRRNKKARNNLR
ncbi:MAG: relaxase/mobilization nuclease domain-containing protein [Sphingobacteriales bacterium]